MAITHADAATVIVRAARCCAVPALLVAALAGCGTSAHRSRSSAASSVVAERAVAPALRGAPAVTPAVGEGQTPNICSLVSKRQIDSVLRGGYTPDTSTLHGWEPRADLVLQEKHGIHSFLYNVDHAYTESGYAQCLWEQGQPQSVPAPTLTVTFTIFPLPVTRAAYLKARTSGGAKAEPVANLGQWAFLLPAEALAAECALNVDVGDTLVGVILSAAPHAAPASCAQLANVIVGRIA